MLDPLGGLLVSGMILKQGAGVGMTALKELVDQVQDPSLPPKVHALLLSMRDLSLPSLPPYAHSSGGDHAETPPASPLVPSSVTELTDSALDPHHPSLPILSIPSIRVFSSGPSFLLELSLVLPKNLTLEEATKIEDLIIERCKEELGGPGRVREVIVRMKAEGAE